jgi:hypothetical protein
LYNNNNKNKNKNMKIELPFDFIEDLKKTDEWEFLNDIGVFQFDWMDRNNRKNIVVDTILHQGISIELLSKLRTELESSILNKTYSFPIGKFEEQKYKTFCKKLDWHLKNADNSDKVVSFGTIKDIPAALETWFLQKSVLPTFLIETDFNQQPYLLTGCTFTPKTKYVEQAYTTLTFKGIRLGSVEVKTFNVKSIHQLTKNQLAKKVTIEEFFEHLDIQLFSLEDEEYLEKVKVVEEKFDEIGTVYDISEMEFITSRNYGKSYQYVNTTNRNISPIVVVDTKTYVEDNSSSTSRRTNQSFLAIPFGKENEIKLPTHTIIAGFHLESHSWVRFDVNSMKPHVFAGPQLMDKLIINEQDKYLVNMLINQSKLELEDIVAGKQGGSLVLATGLPGTGKTLTAQVLSESIGLPLYTVQCSQLGLKPDTIEQKLETVLQNAERWNAVLQIDEADVYIRERGLDLQHNAIVGSFLRMLEKANCILFMTSNIDSIDDAIKSRATALIRYKLPDFEKLIKIFNVLKNQFKVEFGFEPENLFVSENEDDDCYKTVELYNQTKPYSGRDIKSFMKLAKMQIEHLQVEKLSLQDAKMILTYIK